MLCDEANFHLSDTKFGEYGRMRKLAYVAVVIAVIAAIGFGIVRLVGGRGPKVTEPFSFDFEASKETASALADIDDIATIVSSSPFYSGQKALPGQLTDEFDEARAKKVGEIVSDSERLAEDAAKVKSGLDKLRASFYAYLDVLAKESPESMRYVREAAGMALRFQTEEAVAECAYKGIVTESDGQYAKSLMQYARVGRACEFAGLCIDEANTIVGYSAWALASLDKTKNAKIRAANQKLDRDMRQYDSIRGDLSDLARGIGRVHYGLRQLKTADYYYARSAVKFIRDSIPGLREKMRGVSAGKDLSADEIAFINDYITSFEKLGAEMQRYLDSVPKSELIEVSALQPSCPGSACAANEPTDYAKGFMAANAPAQTPEAPKGWLASGWSFAKTAVKTVGHGLQTTAGLAVDTLGAGVKSAIAVGAGVYQGDSWSHVGREIGGNFKEVYANYQNSMSGVKIMRGTYETLEGVDQFADNVGEALTSKAVGTGWTSWGVGKVARAASGLFTGLGKGIALIANRQASAGDMAVGTLEIVGATIGGSKLILRGTQMPKFFTGLAEGSWLSLKRAGNFVMGAFNRLDRRNLIQLARQSFLRGGSTIGFRGMFQEMNQLASIISASNAAIRKEIDRLVITAMQAGSANFRGTLRESLTDFVRTRYAANLKDCLRFVGNTLGRNPSGFADNIVGQWADDMLKEIVDNALLEAPRAAELAGKWTGYVMFTEVTVPEAAKKQEGCDFNEFLKAFKDRKLPTTIVFDGVPADRGSFRMMITAGEGGEYKSYAYTYKEGALAVSQKVDEAMITMNGTARRQDKGYMMEGSISGSQATKNGTISMSGVWQVKK